MTPFERVLEDHRKGMSNLPSVHSGSKKIDSLGYGLSVHKFQLGLLSKGMTMRGVRLKPLKDFYGLKGRSAGDVYPQFMEIFDAYQAEFLMGAQKN